jgi:predicted ArsR family transcriptional regulator
MSMPNTSRDRVLRALCRFDTATTEEISEACGCSKAQARGHLRKLVEAGLATALGGNYRRYLVTDAGRCQSRSAA